MTDSKPNSDWKKSDSSIFWGEIAPCNHLVQIYDNDDILLDSLEGFVISGFETGDNVMIIAMEAHLEALDARLLSRGINIAELIASDQYIPLNAEKTLKRFMSNGWPDEERFNDFVREVVLRARGLNNRRVRAFGEMVAVLWAQGYSGATVHLEHLWNKFCETEAFCLFCSYPKAGFTQDAQDSMGHICSTHTKVIAGDKRSVTEVFYRNYP